MSQNKEIQINWNSPNSAYYYIKYFGGLEYDESTKRWHVCPFIPACSEKTKCSYPSLEEAKQDMEMAYIEFLHEVRTKPKQIRSTMADCAHWKRWDWTKELTGEEICGYYIPHFAGVEKLGLMWFIVPFLPDIEIKQIVHEKLEDAMHEIETAYLAYT